MKDLQIFIEESTAFIKEKIVEIIEDDDHWLMELGIINSEKKECLNIKDLILSKLEDKENCERTDKILQYVLDDYILGEDEEHSIFYGHCDVDSYTRNSALYVFKFNSSFFCYYLPERSLITSDPIPFCKQAILDENNQLEIEKENMNDEYWKNSEFTLDLNFNIQI
jgi:hypothetical protein